ncbi:MAG: MazG nucleotide pyrophosphohydrolase domain-containing protein [Weeksellaceae bacterium]
MNEQQRAFTFDEAQQTQQEICHGLSIENNPLEAFRRLQEEVAELGVAIETNNPTSIANELGDIITLAATIATQFNLMLSIAVGQKIQRNLAKYPPEVRDQMLADGIPSDQIFPILKSQWDTDRDKEFEYPFEG